MGNIGSRHASNVVDGFVLRLARIVDSVLRTINRKLSVLSSYFFSRVFGYDVVFSDELASPTYAAGAGASTATARRGDPLVCGPGNVCIVPASRIQQRLAEKKRRKQPAEHIHTTRMVPKRVDELLDGGSLYWVIRGQISARQRLVAIRPFVDKEGIGR